MLELALESVDKDAKDEKALIQWMLGSAYATMEKWQESLKQYRLAHDSHGRKIWSILSSAGIKERNAVLAYSDTSIACGEEAQGESILREFLERVQDQDRDATVLHRLTHMLGKAGRLTEAVNFAREASEKVGTSSPVYASSLAGLLIAQNRPTEALEWYTRAYEADPRDLRIAYNRSILLFSMDRPSLASSFWLSARGISATGPNSVTCSQENQEEALDVARPNSPGPVAHKGLDIMDQKQKLFSHPDWTRLDAVALAWQSGPGAPVSRGA